MEQFTLIADDNTQETVEVWKEYLSSYEISNESAKQPYVDTWQWRSFILKDIYYVSEYYTVLGAIFFVIDNVYSLACFNDGRNLIKVSNGDDYDEFNQQLATFNYFRAQRSNNTQRTMLL